MTKSKTTTTTTSKKEVFPFWNYADIKNMIDYFEMKEMWNWDLCFMLELLLARRIGDTLSLKWSDIMYSNGKIKDEMNTVVEDKTGKITNIYICDLAKKYVNIYIEKTKSKPLDNLDDFIFPSKGKQEWQNHKDALIYKEITDDVSCIDKWAQFIGRNFSDNRKEKIIKEWKDSGLSLSDYLYQVEYKCALKSQIYAYQKAFKGATEFCGIKYNANTHSVRKSFGYWSRKIHPYDIDSLEILQKIYNHSDTQTTLHYIGLTEERKRQYFVDMGEFVSDVLDGKNNVIDNAPVISIKTDSLMDILHIALNSDGKDKLETFKELVNLVNEMKIS